MSIAPRFIKYRTRSGNYYFYDSGTNEIVRVGELVYRLLDDFQVLDKDEMIRKYRSCDKAKVREALVQLGKLQNRGILCDGDPQTLVRAERISCQGREEEFEPFMRNRRRLLILELTRRCNLRCEYCCYGTHYPQFREHEEQTLPLETAKQVIRDYVKHRPEPCSIGFYGGEPLLEFDLLREIVAFSEDLIREAGLTPAFNISTNGTLLDDEKIHYLVKHDFSVVTSLDGPKETHDHYRVFRNDQHPERRVGSFDVVMRNLERFVELYPDYVRRGFSITFTATADFDSIDDMLRRLQPSFPVVLQSFVRQVEEPAKRIGDRTFQVGCWLPPCQAKSCRKEEKQHRAESEAVEAAVDSPAPSFCNWTQDALQRLQARSRRFVEAVCENQETDRNLNARLPSSSEMFRRSLRRLHRRNVSKRPPKVLTAYRCFPGAVRTFCSTEGDLFPCERTETGELFKLGDAGSGVNVNKAIQLTEVARLIGDCGNCVAKRLCTLCPAVISELNGSGMADGVDFQETCQGLIATARAQLIDYTSIMETSGDMLDGLLRTDKGDDWLDDVSVIMTPEQLRELDRSTEAIEEML